MVEVVEVVVLNSPALTSMATAPQMIRMTAADTRMTSTTTLETLCVLQTHAPTWSAARLFRAVLHLHLLRLNSPALTATATAPQMIRMTAAVTRMTSTTTLETLGVLQTHAPTWSAARLFRTVLHLHLAEVVVVSQVVVVVSQVVGAAPLLLVLLRLWVLRHPSERIPFR